MIIYTCVTNDYDDLEDPVKLTEDCQYICFTNTPKKWNVWEPRKLLKEFSDPRLTARYHKTIGANTLESEYSLWQDGKITFLREFDLLSDYDIGLIPHPRRNNIWDEGRRVIQIKKECPIKIRRQLREYDCTGLYETAIVVRNKRCEQLNIKWWNEIEKHSTRDQISLPQVLKTEKLKIHKFDFDYENNNLFKVKHHPFSEIKLF